MAMFTCVEVMSEVVMLEKLPLSVAALSSTHFLSGETVTTQHSLHILGRYF